MKKVWIFLLIFSMMLCLLCLPCFAADGAATGEATLWTRCLEFFYRYSAEIFSILGTAVLFIYSVVARIRSGKSDRSLSSTVNQAKAFAEQTATRQGPVIAAVNEMIEGYNAIKQDYDARSAAEDERNRAVAAVMAQNTAIIEILQTVYANSKNLPQGVKDIVNLKYANCLKTLSSEEALAHMAKSFRAEINEGTEIVSSEETEV